VPGAPARRGLAFDAWITIVSRFGLAILIFGTDVLLARLLGPAAKGRFSLVLLTSQLTALVVGWGMDDALGVVSARDAVSARHGIANALVWTAVVGSSAVLVTCWLYGLPTSTRPTGPLTAVIPNLNQQQFLLGALAIPGEVFFALGLFVLLGRRLVAAYAGIRILRRGILLTFVAATAAIARLSLDAALLTNLGALVVTAVAIGWVARNDGTLGFTPSLSLLREQLAFGSRNIPGDMAERLQLRADAFIVNAALGVRATGVYSVTAGLAETLWYVPNAMGTVMFSRAVGAAGDAARVAAVLTRTTIAVAVAMAIPAFALGPRLVRIVYGSQFTDAGVALRYILPGIVAYSVVAVQSRYIVGRGRPGTSTLIMVAGMVVNISANLVLVPRLGIIGASISSSLSYTLTAAVMLAVFLRLSGLGLREALILRRADVRSAFRFAVAFADRVRGRRRGPVVGVRGGDAAAAMIVEEREPGRER
jgi:O-antigen/teichoic acid export membrane protein